jgi:antitoxin component HigA of HigAB toxin-antitoxin module
MRVSVIKSKADYEEALARIDRLMVGDPGGNTPAGRELKQLVAVVEEYEDIHYPIISE